MHITAFIIENGDVYEDVLGPKYWPQGHLDDAARRRRHRAPEVRLPPAFQGRVPERRRPELAERIAPDLWELPWPLMTEQRREIAARIIYDLKDNLA